MKNIMHSETYSFDVSDLDQAIKLDGLIGKAHEYDFQVGAQTFSISNEGDTAAQTFADMAYAVSAKRGTVTVESFGKLLVVIL